ncbi:MAG TPA: glycosyltransferase family 4 protein [Candidatus Dormibacteraeota bacterium]|nr:glycosyltransferase family 4 protein [Candidatus Dormibacteraeota bacterium]
MATPVKTLIVVSHPVQYSSHLYRLYAADSRLDLTVAYCSLRGAERTVDPEFGAEYAWDVPLMDGYRWEYPVNRSPGLPGPLSLVNPGLWKLITRGRFDVVACLGWWAVSFWIAAVAAKVSGSALIFSTDAHTIEPYDGSPWKVPIKRWVIPRIVGFGDGILAMSDPVASFLAALKIPASSIFVTPYAVDTQFFAERADVVDREQVRLEWAIPSDALVALFVGKFIPRKRPEDLIAALEQAPDCYGVFAGDGEMRDSLIEDARNRGLQDRVRFIGFVNQTGLPAVYASADVLVVPSDHEYLAYVVNEAFACGRPAIVTTACGPAGDLVIEGETGMVVPVRDPTSIAKALNRLTADRQLAGRMGVQARRKLDDWGPRENASAFAEACVELARRRK